MKPFKTIYLTLDKGNIIFPKEIQYIGDEYYLCTDQLNEKYVVHSWNVAKMSQNDFDSFIKTVHTAMYTDDMKGFLLDDISNEGLISLCIYPNGCIHSGDCSCTLYVPRNCMKWENCLLKGYCNDSYILCPCDDKGRIIEKKKSDINPYSNNCNTVYNVIANNPGISTFELIDLLGWPPNSVTSRISELVSGSRIYSVGRVTNPKSGRKVHKWMTMEDVEGNCYVL